MKAKPNDWNTHYEGSGVEPPSGEPKATGRETSRGSVTEFRDAGLGDSPAPAAPADGLPEEPRRWHWIGDLCQFVDGQLVARMNHPETLSSMSPPVVFLSDYDLLRSRLTELQQERFLARGEALRAGFDGGSLNEIIASLRDRALAAEAGLTETERVFRVTSKLAYDMEQRALAAEAALGEVSKENKRLKEQQP